MAAYGDEAHLLASLNVLLLKELSSEACILYDPQNFADGDYMLIEGDLHMEKSFSPFAASLGSLRQCQILSLMQSDWTPQLCLSHLCCLLEERHSGSLHSCLCFESTLDC